MRRSATPLAHLRRAAWFAPAALLAGVAVLPGPAIGQEDHSGLTRASYRRNCLLCHSGAPPEGVSPDILAGLHATSPGLSPREAMPGVVCWRRCDACKIPETAPAEP